MPKGAKRKHTFRSCKDELTGKLVLRLTDPDTLCHHPYFYNKMITNDGRYLIYAMETDGARAFCMMDIQQKMSVQLTHAGGLCDYSANLSVDDKYLFFCQNKALIRLNMDTLAEDIIYQSPEGWWAYDNPAISSDGRYAVTIEVFERDKIDTSSGWESFEKQWELKPLCRVVLIDIAKRNGKVIYQEACWLGHPQIRPNRNDTISFCHEGPSHRIDARLWLMDVDGTNVRCARPQSDEEMITHEFWLQDGSQMAYVYRNQNRQGKETQDLVDPETYMPKVESVDIRQKIMFLNPETLKETFIMECSKYCHCISDSRNQYMVGDGQLAYEPFIFLADLKQRTERKLCLHNTSWRSYGTNQDSHPHPAFTPDGNRIIFTSDKDGKPAIYMVDIF